MIKYSKNVLKALFWAENTRFNADELHKKYPKAFFLENKDTDTQGFAVIIDKELIIAFRGSQQAQDWLTDFTAWHTVYPYGNNNSNIQVHKGFITAYKSVRGNIHLFIAQNRNNFNRIFICGHSLGGALATLCAVDIQYNYPGFKIDAFPTANPRVGNKAFVESFNRRLPQCVRTYMRTDLVPELPPTWFEYHTKGGYKHAGKANPIGPRNILIGLKNWFHSHFKWGFPESVTNHAIALYRKYA